MNEELRHADLSYRIIGCAMDVHTAIGPGMDELYYHRALSRALERQQIAFRYKPLCRVMHRGRVADTFEPDLFVNDQIVLELKALTGCLSDGHMLQLLCYLKHYGRDLGIIINFGLDRLVQKRVVFSEKDPRVSWNVDRVSSRHSSNDSDLLSRLRKSLLRLLDEHGLGYRGTTYQGMLRAELNAEEIPFEENPKVCVGFRDQQLGECHTRGFLVANTAFVKVGALATQFRAAEIATVRTYLRHLGRRWGLVVNFGKAVLEVEGVGCP